MAWLYSLWIRKKNKILSSCSQLFPDFAGTFHWHKLNSISEVNILMFNCTLAKNVCTTFKLHWYSDVTINGFHGNEIYCMLNTFSLAFVYRLYTKGLWFNSQVMQSGYYCTMRELNHNPEVYNQLILPF